MKRNISLVLATTFISSIASEILGGGIYDIFLFQITSSTAMMGFLSGAFGLAQLVVFFALAKYGDGVSYHMALRRTALIGIVVFSVSIVAFCGYFNYEVTLGALFFSSALGGVFYGLRNPWMQTLFSREVKHISEESRLFSVKRIMNNMGSLVGSLVCLVVFLINGQEWKLSTLRIILLAGLIPFAFDTLATCWFRSLDFLPLLPLLPFDSALNSTDASLKEALVSSMSSVFPLLGDRQLHHDTAARHQRVKYILVCSDLIFMFGAGMTVGYLILFLKEEWGLPPWIILLISCTTLLSNAVLTKTADLCALKIGARFTMFFFCLGGTLCLLLLGVTLFIRLPVWTLCLICVLRTSFMNCTGGVADSLLMDHVEDENKTGFNAVECLNTATWTGSAVLGGLLIAWKGYHMCFLITSGFYFIACTLLLFLPK